MKVCEIKVRFLCEDGKNHEEVFRTDGTSEKTINGFPCSSGWYGKNNLEYRINALVEDFLKNYKK